MPPNLKQFAQGWVINTLAVLVATRVIDGFDYDTSTDLIVATLLLGLLNAFVRPILMIISLPILLFSLGLFTLVINAGLLYLVAEIVKGFHIATFWTACKGAIVIAIINVFLNLLTGGEKMKVQFKRSRKPPANPDSGGSGPVIDV